MGVFEMVAVVVVATSVAGFGSRWLKYRERTHALRAGDDGELAREVERLRERVATLERIVTDPAYDLHRRFDDLREPRRAA
jgi:3-oxoacyl-ACP reductase-like protein